MSLHLFDVMTVLKAPPATTAHLLLQQSKYSQSIECPFYGKVRIIVGSNNSLMYADSAGTALVLLFAPLPPPPPHSNLEPPGDESSRCHISS